MNCSLCISSEMTFNLNKDSHVPVKHPEGVKAIICSNCTQRILSSTQEQIKDAYEIALNAGELGKAKELESFLGEKERNVGETEKPKRNLIRKGPVRMARPTLDKIRAQQAVI